jgi:hypothetical protein
MIVIKGSAAPEAIEHPNAMVNSTLSSRSAYRKIRFNEVSSV